MRTSGLILELYDDVQGSQLRDIYPAQDSLPEFVKQAYALSAEERMGLPDDAFALVLVDGDQKLRKYACIDAGNTQVAIDYFLANHDKLPEEAQKVAAANLLQASDWYGLEVPDELSKLAGIGGPLSALGTMGVNFAKNQAAQLAANPVAHTLKTVGTAMTAQQVLGTGKEIKNNLKAVKPMGGNVSTPNEVFRAGMEVNSSFSGEKTAEAAGTHLMPLQAPGNLAAKSTLPVVKKAASMGHLVSGHKKSENENFGPIESPPYDGYTKGVQPDAPQANVLHPYVHVEGKEAPKTHAEKKASQAALRGRYPLDSYMDVKLASAYFDEYGKRMPPEDRREFCFNLVKRASELGLSVGDEVRKYGSQELAPLDEVKVAFECRRSICPEDFQPLLSQLEGVALGLQVKQASATDLEVLCAAVEEFDKLAGVDFYYDRDVPDPYWTVYGVKTSAAHNWSALIGNDMVTRDDLERLAKTHMLSLTHSYGEDFAKEFRKDPVAIFESLPMEQKKMLARLATDNAPGSATV